jgi:hypothetical protein
LWEEKAVNVPVVQKKSAKLQKKMRLLCLKKYHV